MMQSRHRPTRRHLLRAGAGALATAALAPSLRALAEVDGSGPSLASERLPFDTPPTAIGDLRDGRAVLWSRADRPARMQVRWATTASMRDARELPSIHALTDADLTAKTELAGLPPDQTIAYEVAFRDLADGRPVGPPARGSFRTPPSTRRDVRFVWSGDTVGQGWGINPDLGGMRIYDTMLAGDPDFFVNSGDTIYADGPVQAEVVLPDGTIWRNLVTDAKAKVAETLDEFRGQYRYNLLDGPHRRFHAQVPVFAQWDDHEVTNNWYPGKRLDGDGRYAVKSVDLLAARAVRAFQEYQPVRRHPLDPERLFDRFAWGPSLEVFRLDLRSYRGPNSDEQSTQADATTAILGARQLAWLKNALATSTATWKIIASDMPLGVVIADDFRTGRGAEGVALRNGPPAGRELEIADLLTFIRDRDVRNVVWITADVHYTAAHFYDPARARYDRFKPFWEFVSGPLNAGTFGPNLLDDTFGPQLVYRKVPPTGEFNLSPRAGLQFFGQVDLDGETEALTVRLRNAAGETLFTQRIDPDGS